MTEDESDDDDDEGENYRKSNYHDRPGPSSFRYTREGSAEEDDEQPLDDDTCVLFLLLPLLYQLSVSLQRFRHTATLHILTWN